MRSSVARPRGLAAPRADEVCADEARADEVRAAGDFEISIRVFADGGSITVRRRTIADADGAQRTVGIDALVR